MKSSFHTYIGNLKRSGASTAFVEAVARNARPLFERGLPVILTLGQLAYATRSPYQYLVRVVSRHVNPYEIFAIRKRRGGHRTICIPSPILRNLQRWIHEHILCSKYALKGLSASVTAYRPDANHISNARVHVGADWLIKLDIRQFFESVSERQVYYVFRRLGYRALVAFYLARLCTRILPYPNDRRSRAQTGRWHNKIHHNVLPTSVVGHLPQGAPTSPMLANLVCAPLDDLVQSVARKNLLAYTRYADDLVLSGDLPDRKEAARISREVVSIVGKFGFGINHQKTSVAKNGARKIVTGLSIEGDRIRLPRFYKDKIRQELYYLQMHGVDEHCEKIGYKNRLTYLLRLKGRIRYVRLIEVELGNKMQAIFDTLFPDFNLLESTIRN